MDELWTVSWKPVGQGGLYIFSRNGIPTYDIPHRQCDTEERLHYWIEHLREKNWFTKTLELEFYRLYLDGRKFAFVVKMIIPIF